MNLVPSGSVPVATSPLISKKKTGGQFEHRSERLLRICPVVRTANAPQRKQRHSYQYFPHSWRSTQITNQPLTSLPMRSSLFFPPLCGTHSLHRLFGLANKFPLSTTITFPQSHRHLYLRCPCFPRGSSPSTDICPNRSPISTDLSKRSSPFLKSEVLGWTPGPAICRIFSQGWAAVASVGLAGIEAPLPAHFRTAKRESRVEQSALPGRAQGTPGRETRRDGACRDAQCR